MDEQQLKQLRDKIDSLDEQIQTLINERAACAQDIAGIKQAAGEGTNIYRPEREADILRTVQARNNGPLGDAEIARLFQEIMSACRALEKPVSVAFLGPEGTYTQAAALKHFGHSIGTTALNAVDEIFRDVEAGNSSYGVVAVENSTEGGVDQTLDMLISSSLKICAEVEMRIHHNLLSTEKELSAIKQVCAHPQALAQCREWLDANLAGVERVAVSSNAEGARMASEQPGVSAIAGEEAAEIYNINILAENIEDEPDNTTRFVVIGRSSPPPSGEDKTSLLMSMPNKPGALYHVLGPLSKHKVSMTRIESRPSRKGIWDYVYFIDIEGHADDKQVAEVLTALEKETSMLKVLGSYPRAAH